MMTTTTEVLSSGTFLSTSFTTTTTTKTNDLIDSSIQTISSLPLDLLDGDEAAAATVVANVTIDELVESCCSEALPSSKDSSSQLNSSSASPTHLVRFVHSQSSLVSQIDETITGNNPPNRIESLPLQQQQQHHQRPSEQVAASLSSHHHESPVKPQPPLINVTRLPSPFSTNNLKPKTTIIEATSSMQNTTNLSNITANNISVNNFNVNIHTTSLQQTPTIPTTNCLLTEQVQKKRKFDEKQTTEIVSQILKNIKEESKRLEVEVSPTEQQQSSLTTTTNYNIHIDAFNFSSNEQTPSTLMMPPLSTTSNVKKARVRKEAKALTRIIVKDEPTDVIIPTQISPNFSRAKKTPKNNAARLALAQIATATNSVQPLEFIPVPYGWQRRILASDLVVYLSPTNVILDSLDAVRRYLEMPASCKCGLQCPLIVDKVFNFDPMIKAKSWEVTQVLEGTHCRQKSNILEMATLTNCIDSFCETEQKPVKRRKRTHPEATNGNVFVCASNSSNLLQTNPTGNAGDSVVFVNSTGQTHDGGQSMTWTPIQQTGNTPPSKRPRGRPRKTAVTPPVIAQLAVKSAAVDTHQQPVPSSILSPPASVSSTSQTNLVHRNSTSPSTHHLNGSNGVRYLNDNVLTPPVLASSTNPNDTNVIARVPSIFDQVKSTPNESTFAVLSGVQNVLLSPNRDSTNNNNNSKRVRLESASSVASASNPNAGKPVTLNVNALKPDFVRSPAAAQKPCSSSSIAAAPNQMDVISLMGTSNQTQLMVNKPLPKTIAPAGTITTVPGSSSTDEYLISKSTNSNNEHPTDGSQPLMIDFNDPSTTNFLLSALASGASSDSNAIVNHLFHKAQTQHHRPVTSPPPLPTASLPTQVTTAASSIKKKLPIISAGLRNCTETTNLLPIAAAPTSTAPMRQSVVLHVPSNSTTDYIDQPPQQQIVFSSSNTTDNPKQHQQIFFINNKPYVIQQKLNNDQSTQQRLVLTPSTCPSHELPVQPSRNVVTVANPTSTTCGPSTLDDAGNYLLLNGAVEPKTLRTLLKGLDPLSISGVDNLIDTIHQFEHTTNNNSAIAPNNNLLTKSVRTTKASPAKKNPTDKPPSRRRAPKKIKQEEQQPPLLPPPALSQMTMTMAPPAPVVVEQQQWQTDFNAFDFSTTWGSDTNLNSLLLNDDFDTAASFDDVNFGDFEPYMNGNNNPNNNHSNLMINNGSSNSNETTIASLPSLFVKPLPPDTLPSVDHLLP